MTEIKMTARPWTPQDLIDDLQDIINEESNEYLNTRRTTLEMALAYLKEHFAEKWISVTERLPDLELVDVKTYDMDLFPCLVCKNMLNPQRKKIVTKAWYDGEGFMDSDCIRITKFVTHWMLLPEAPKENENG